MGGLAVFAALVIALAALVWKTWHAPAYSVPKYTRLTYRTGLYFTARFAPDGRTVVYSAAQPRGSFRVFSTAYGARESRDLGLPDDTAIQSISATGQMALLLRVRFYNGGSDGTLALAPLSGGAPREMLPRVASADWSPNGSDLAIVRVLENGSRLEYPIGHTLEEISGGALFHARISPAGDRIAYVRSIANVDTVSVVDVHGHKTDLLSNRTVPVTGLAWSGSGKEVWVTTGGDHPACEALTLSGNRRVVAYSSTGVWQHLDIAPQGNVLFVSSQFRRVLQFGRKGESGERELSWLDGSEAHDISRDGKILLINEWSETSGADLAVYIRATDGSPAVRLGTGGGHALSLRTRGGSLPRA
jgi:Tol biopolymer transport system component